MLLTHDSVYGPDARSHCRHRECLFLRTGGAKPNRLLRAHASCSFLNSWLTSSCIPIRTAKTKNRISACHLRSLDSRPSSYDRGGFIPTR